MFKRLPRLLTLLACAALLGAAPSPVLPGESLLLNLEAYGLQPVAIWGLDGQFREVPSEVQPEQVEAIVGQFFKPGQTYEAFRNGQSKGTLKLTEYNPAGCSGFGFVSGKMNPPVPEDRRFERFVGFTSGFPGRRSYAGSSPVTATQRKTAESLARKSYTSKGITAEQLKRFQVDDVQSLKLNQGKSPALMISSRLGPLPGSDTGCHTHQLMLIAELKGKNYVPKLELLKKDTQAEGICSGYNFISSFEAEPQSEYLLTQGYGYEWNWYEIYKRAADGNYHQVFSGGGGGC